MSILNILKKIFRKWSQNSSKIQEGIKEKQLYLDEIKTEHIINVANNIPNLMANVREEKKLIILIDIVGFSKSSTRDQVYKIYQFQHYLLGKVLTDKFSFSNKINVFNFVPTGDGCYIVADQCEPQSALEFLVTLISGFKKLKDKNDNSALAVRVSALLGDCVPFIDMAHHKNYIGEGMNEASRILSGGQKVLEEDFLKKNPDKQILDSKLFSRNSLYVGESLAAELKNFGKKASAYFEFKDVADKHGIKRDVFILQGIK